MTVSVKAILPKRELGTKALEREFQVYLKEFAKEIRNEMSEYPEARPWTSRTPKSGPRAGGRRTGQYKAGWSSPPTPIPAFALPINSP